MRILVTGCAGFIGSHLCERLINAGHTVNGIDNLDDFYSREIKMKNMKWLVTSPRFSFHHIDICSEEQLNTIKDDFDIAVHLAAKAGVRPSIEQPLKYIETNIAGTQNVINLLLRKGVRKLVFASSSSVYGDKTVSPYSERALVDYPISPYAFSKKSCELILYTHFHLYQLSSVVLRFFTVYGPRQRPDLAINKFFSAVENGQPITIYGDGSTSRDYTFIDDIIQGIMSSINLVLQGDPIYEVINLGNNRPVRLLDLIRKVEETIGKEAILTFQQMQPGDVLMTCADTSKAKEMLNYNARTSLEDGLKYYYQWRQSMAHS